MSEKGMAGKRNREKEDKQDEEGKNNPINNDKE